MQAIKAIFLGSALALSFASPATAQTEAAQASLGNMSGDVLVQRGGNFYRLSEGDSLFEGDKVFTREGASIDINISGCGSPVSLSGNQYVDLAGGCNATPVALSQAGLPPQITVAGPASAAAGGSGALAVLGVVAGVGVIAAVAGGGGGGDDDGGPSSP